MQYNKYRADQLFDGYRMRSNEEVLVMTSEGIVEDIIPVGEAGEDIQYYQGILAPGLINCHCHLELSHMKDRISRSTGLAGFVTQIIQGRHSPDEEILAAIERAEDEMLGNGIVAVGDICNNALTLPQKLKGRIFYHNFIEVSGFAPQVAEQRFEAAIGIFHEYARHYSIPVMSNSIVPHAPYSVSDALWKKIIDFPGNQLMTIHNQESEEETELFLTKQGPLVNLYDTLGIDISFFEPSGKSSLQACLPRFISNQQVILVHNVHTTQRDLQALPSAAGNDSNPQLYWCFCPNANLYITGRLPDIELFRKAGQQIVLGTDSLASNARLNILSEMQTIHESFPSIDIAELMGWATINGAKALQMDNILGSFEKGKQPGVTLIHSGFSAVQRLL